MINKSIIIHVTGVLLLIMGGFMLSAAVFSLAYGEEDLLSILMAGGLTMAVGAICWKATKDGNRKIGKREGFLIVSIGWLAISLFGALPYLISGSLGDLSCALFESVSGLTTTGASVVNDIEALPRGILFWRSLTQWLGGMGIIVLTVALLPLLGIGGVELFVAEAPGPTSDKIHPRITETARRLWLIYVGFTVLLMLILWALGMSFYDAINHALTTMATGGFSTKNASIAAFPSKAIQYTLTLFMFVAGINYTVIYFGLKTNFKRVWASDEFKAYLIGVLTLILLVTLSILLTTNLGPEQAFREAAFQLISVITTTGFVSADYTAWTPALTLLFFILLFVGGCAGSTSGGIKVIRHVVLFKNTFLELKRLLHPRAILRIKVDNKIVSPKVLAHILVFLLLYLLIFIVGSLVMAVILADFEQPMLSAIGAVATSLGNVGPSIGDLGPVDNFAAVPAVGKWLLVFFMLLGRLEFFTLLVLFTPFYWNKN